MKKLLVLLTIAVSCSPCFAQGGKKNGPSRRQRRERAQAAPDQREQQDPGVIMLLSGKPHDEKSFFEKYAEVELNMWHNDNLPPRLQRVAWWYKVSEIANAALTTGVMGYYAYQCFTQEPEATAAPTLATTHQLILCPSDPCTSAVAACLELCRK